MEENMSRYGVIRDKNPREIVLLRGSGCKWRRCTFCDYHLDSSDDSEANLLLNGEVLSHITGEYRHLEVINSGSFCDLDENTLDLIEEVCRKKKISLLHFECHWLYRKEILALKKRFLRSGIQVKVKTGVETFDPVFREGVLCKGIGVSDPAAIAAGFDEACLLFGLPGQTLESMREDIETALAHFERVCVNIMTENTASLQPDPEVIRQFKQFVYPLYKENEKIDILLHNTDFGVGGKCYEK